MLLHCNAGGALFTVSFVSHDKEDGRGTDQHVDNGLQNGPRAQDHIHDIAVKTSNCTEANETPVKRTYHSQYERDHVYYFHRKIFYFLCGPTSY